MKTVLGLTGGSGSGKSCAATYLQSLGAYVIDADKIARQVVAPGEPALFEIEKAFPGVLFPDGSLDRKKLGSIVFSDPEALSLLNSITHGYIKEEIVKAVANSTQALLVIDAPLLFDCGLDSLCSSCIGIIADKTLRIRRLMSRDGLTEEEAKNRISSQKTEDFFRQNCDYIIENNGEETALRHELDSILKELNIETK